MVAELAATGFGANGGSWGWNADLRVSDLVTSWFDISGGVVALETNKPETGGLSNVSRSVHLLTYGPVFAMGFRF